MTVALMVPAYSRDNDLVFMTVENIKAWLLLVDFVVVSEDYEYHPLIDEVSDYYVLHPHVGVADSSNIGWALAYDRGADYVIICDSDVRPHKNMESVNELCIPDKVAVPLCQGWPDRASVAPMMVVPREVAHERGMYDSCEGRHSMKHFDADYQVRVRDIIEHVTSFEIVHLNGGSQTTGKYMKACSCGRCNGY